MDDELLEDLKRLSEIQKKTIAELKSGISTDQKFVILQHVITDLINRNYEMARFINSMNNVNEISNKQIDLLNERIESVTTFSQTTFNILKRDVLKIED